MAGKQGPARPLKNVHAPDAYRIRIPIRQTSGRRFRVLIYARYSTEEQNPRSIADQVDYCRRFLQAVDVADADIDLLSDEGISGERVSRPGIDQVRAGLALRRWDLILSEDSSRLYRNETACLELVETAVDQSIRVLCLGDDVDTAEEDWPDRLHEAQRHHSCANKYTSRRIRRSHDSLWKMGAAIGLLRPGYLRTPTFPATEREPAKGPFFDAVDPKWEKTIYEAFERVAHRECREAAAAWLTQTGLPKTSNSKDPSWSAKNLKALIRRTDYRGIQHYRSTTSQKQYRSGTRRQDRNSPEAVLTREMPHLQIVPDWLWYQANAVLDEQDRGGRAAAGRDNPLYGVPRDARGPLSKVFKCRCGARMELIGPNGYRCAHAKAGIRRCWIRATARRDCVHETIASAIQRRLDQMAQHLEPLLAALADLCGQQFSHDTERAELEAEEQRLHQELQKLETIATTGDEPPQQVLAWIADREAKLTSIEAQRERLDTEQRSVSVPSKADLLHRIETLTERLTRMDRDVASDLKLLVSDLHTVPCQQAGSNKVVLRAKFKLCLLGLLPAGLSLFLGRLDPDLIPKELAAEECCVELFARSSGPEHWEQALERAERKETPAAIARALGITKRRADLAIEYGRMMRRLGLSDPYIELTEPPAAASRWGRQQSHPAPDAVPSPALESPPAPAA